jgi:branched-chain amino acid transport system permease protein
MAIGYLFEIWNLEFFHFQLMKKWALFILILILALLPLLITAKYPLHLLIMVGIWSIAASSLNLILGYTGQGSLGHAAFFGIGAYTSALLMIKLGFSFWLALPSACVVAALFGFLIGLPALRTRGSYFAIATLAFYIIVTILIEHWEDFTQGGAGISGIPKPHPIPLPLIGKITFTTMAAQYYLVFFFLALTLFFIHRIVHSPVGKTYQAIRGGGIPGRIFGRQRHGQQPRLLHRQRLLCRPRGIPLRLLPRLHQPGYNPFSHRV